MRVRKILYGGAITGKAEYNALLKSIKKSIKSGNWQLGEEAEKFCKEASAILGVKYAFLCNSGSSAGLLALSALELPKGSEVIISATTFPTIFNIIIQCGLVPVVVDAEPGTYNFRVDDVEKAITEKTGAIIAIHVVGNPVDMPKLMAMVNRKAKKIYVIEDNCDGWGSSIDGKSVGSYGDISFTSFHAAHIVSLGVGGGVFTDNADLARNVGMYRDWGRQANLTQRKNTEYQNLPEDQNPRFIYPKIGYNFNMLELQAAMGRVQLEKTEKFKRARKENFDYLYKHLGKYPLLLPKWNETDDVCWFSFPLSYENRPALLEYLEKNGIETRTIFGGNIIRHPAYANVEYRVSGELTGADYILKNSFWISCHPRLTKADLEYIVKVFDDFFTGR